MQVELSKVGGGIELFFDGNRMDMTDDQFFMNSEMFLDSSLAVAVKADDRLVSSDGLHLKLHHGLDNNNS